MSLRDMRVGGVYAIQEIQSYLVGRVAEITPTVIHFEVGESAWVRDMGPTAQAQATGRVVEAVRIAAHSVERAAVRWWWVWPHPIPGDPLPAELLRAVRDAIAGDE